MSRLNMPAKVGGTAELREVMDALAAELRAVATAADSLRKQVATEALAELVASGVATATAEGLAGELANKLHLLDVSLHSTADYAAAVSVQTEMLGQAARNARYRTATVL